ncbi:hypothetical protein [Pseudoalteromonas piscicida]|uniref:hypothetical protein n=1 Tax=Pseudoalteromonas piscicida TaxID=43662 RepID=UPI001CB6FA46|nr:hypothetical protein [Pseudoalteromonas piscicida]
MFQTTLKKEWLDTKRQGQALWLGGIAVLLLLLACLTGFKSHQSYQQAVTEVSQSEQLRWLNQGEKGPIPPPTTVFTWSNPLPHWPHSTRDYKHIKGMC